MQLLLSVSLFFGLLGAAFIIRTLYFKLVPKEPLTRLPTHGHPSKEKSEFDSSSLPTTGPVPSSICSSDHATMNRAQWVERLHNYFAYFRHKSGHNCLVINEQLEYLFNSEDVVAEAVVEYIDVKHGAIPYRVVVFNDGKVINLGDGGYINWHFSGKYDRIGVSTVVFSSSGKRVVE
ncbi:hypothetical protein K505DRAFT_371515 [Melanomma pulvis-pyrius CBS 109.77]|uniref:Uncharacterized protein n=1 Tax=Melanomma pulvis-pyrius CBS 109.77 TaxID=1314802 RepID=A0A6A6XQL1_9PLEO|nr:hypothetical protein K505DRAFT_371515 [Melanomma pulvis-pyrius CBS 109.77]